MYICCIISLKSYQIFQLQFVTSLLKGFFFNEKNVRRILPNGGWESPNSKENGSWWIWYSPRQNFWPCTKGPRCTHDVILFNRTDSIDTTWMAVPFSNLSFWISFSVACISWSSRCCSWIVKAFACGTFVGKYSNHGSQNENGRV